MCSFGSEVGLLRFVCGVTEMTEIDEGSTAAADARLWNAGFLHGACWLKVGDLLGCCAYKLTNFVVQVPLTIQW